MDILIQKNINVEMRDGVILATDVYRPNGEGPFPTLIARVPYNKELTSVLVLLMPDPLRLAQAGYAVVVQDCRGCFQSEGEPNPFFHEANDGVDTIAWAARQAWSNGAVGMVGGSYLGAVQWLASAENPPALRAIAPYITSDQLYNYWTYQGGAFQLGFCLFWALGYFALPEVTRRLETKQATLADITKTLRSINGLEQLYWRLPLTDTPELHVAPFYLDWLAHPTNDDYWQKIAPNRHYEQMTAPALIIGGWFDPFLGGTLASYRAIRARGGSSEARQSQLVIGPWSHGVWHGVFPERDFGILASTDAADLTGSQIAWFDQWLKEDATAPAPPVKLFVMGVDEWREEEAWPLPNTDYRKLYLHSGGSANSLNGDGKLKWEQPDAAPPDLYRYDPRDPVPTSGGATLLMGTQSAINAGPRDQRQVEQRMDVLVYTTKPLECDLSVIGPVELVLFVSSSAEDTDFTGKLVDVYPDGRALLVTDGILRARYRHSFNKPELLQPNKIYQLTIDLIATANVFKAGHCIRLELSSSNFPRFDRNTNSGGVIANEQESDFQVAENRVYHDAAYPSHLLLPIAA